MVCSGEVANAAINITCRPTLYFAVPECDVFKDKPAVRPSAQHQTAQIVAREMRISQLIILASLASRGAREFRVSNCLSSLCCPMSVYTTYVLL